MEKKNIEDIMESFHEEYQEDPEGWSFWVSPPSDSDDFYEAYMIHGEEAFFLKLDSIFTPNPVGVGTKFGIEEDQLVDNLPEFGFRRFNREETEKFLENLPKPDNFESEEEFKKKWKKSRKNLVKKALQKKPIPFESLQNPGEMATLGPYSSQNPLSYISKKQEEMKRELTRKLEKKINRSYPGYY